MKCSLRLILSLLVSCLSVIVQAQTPLLKVPESPTTAPSQSTPEMEAQNSPPPHIVPARVDEQGRIVLREHIGFSGAIGEKPIPGVEPVEMQCEIRSDLQGQDIQRVVKPEAVGVFDVEGNDLPWRTEDVPLAPTHHLYLPFVVR